MHHNTSITAITNEELLKLRVSLEAEWDELDNKGEPTTEITKQLETVNVEIHKRGLKSSD